MDRPKFSISGVLAALVLLVCAAPVSANPSPWTGFNENDIDLSPSIPLSGGAVYQHPNFLTASQVAQADQDQAA